MRLLSFARVGVAAGVLVAAAACGGDAAPAAKPKKEEPPAPEEKVEPPPPVLSPACQTVVDGICDIARAPCSEIRAELRAIGLPEPMCVEAAQHIGVLQEVSPDQQGAAAAKLLTVTSDKAEYTAEERTRLAAFAKGLEEQYRYVAKDGSDDRLPETGGTLFYMGTRLPLAVSRHEARLATAPPWRMRLDDGVWATGALTDGVLVTLVTALEAHVVRRGKPPAEDTSGTLVLRADADLPWGTIAPLLHSAHNAGHTDVAIAARDGRELRESRVTLHSASDRVHERDPRPVPVEILSTGFRIGSVAAKDLEALGAEARRLSRVDGQASTAILEVDPSTTMQRLMTTIDALAACRLDDAVKGAELPAECQLWLVSVDPAA